MVGVGEKGNAERASMWVGVGTEYKNTRKRGCTVIRSRAYTMAQSRCFSLLGDSNTKRHMNSTNCRDRPLMSGCQVLPCGRLSMLTEALKAVRNESNVVIIACLTNFLTSSEDTGSSASFRVEPVLLETLDVLGSFASALPECIVVVSPPMYRRSPLWYRDGLPEVLIKFSDIFKNRPSNVLIAQSFQTPELEGDGVHLTAYSGLEYVLHLFDSACKVIDESKSPLDETSARTTEAVRVLEDRMVAIEQDHRRLVKAFDTKFAEDAELHDFQENVRWESWFIMEGTARLPSGLGSREWQEKAKVEVQTVLKLLMGSERPIVFVQNATRKAKDAPAGYSVQMPSAAVSKEIRDKFGSFFFGRVDKRPPALKHVSIRHRVTVATPVRIAILRVFGQRYLASNPGSKIQVINYAPRPLLKLTPPSSASDRKVMTYNFIQAIRMLPANFEQSEIDEIFKWVNPNLYGSLRPTFVVISDDMVKKKFFKTGQSGSGAANLAVPPGSDGAAPLLGSGTATPSGSGDQFPPLPPGSPMSTSTVVSVSGSRNGKRSNPFSDKSAAKQKK